MPSAQPANAPRRQPRHHHRSTSEPSSTFIRNAQTSGHHSSTIFQPWATMEACFAHHQPAAEPPRSHRNSSGRAIATPLSPAPSTSYHLCSSHGDHPSRLYRSSTIHAAPPPFVNVNQQWPTEFTPPPPRLHRRSRSSRAVTLHAVTHNQGRLKSVRVKP